MKSLFLRKLADSEFVGAPQGGGKMSVFLFRDLESLFVPVLRKCTTMSELRKIHGNVVKHSLTQSSFLVTKMVSICERNGEVEYARLLFEKMSEPNVFLYNAVIRCFTRNGLCISAVEVFKKMLRKGLNGGGDEYTFQQVIKACGGVGCVELGMQVHGYVWKINGVGSVVLGNGLIEMYARCGCVESARKMFDELSERDVASWNAVVNGYLRAGWIDEARRLFEEMEDKTVAAWSGMISGFVRIGRADDAIKVFQEMQMVGVEPNEGCVTSVLMACGQVGALELGRWVYAYADKNGFLQKTFVGNAVIEMYAKCGSIDEAWRVFEEMSYRDVISWSNMIRGLANHGKAREAVQLFEEMKAENNEPNNITFLGIISACAHAGFTEQGLKYFESMTKECDIEPEIEHYGCLVDILGRAGRFDRALMLIQKMPMKPDAKIWGSLLSSCRTHSNLEVAVIVMEHLLELEPNDIGNYILLSNIYSKLGKWEEVSKMRKLIRSKRLKKTPGCSLIEVNNLVEEFVAGDNSKPFSQEIFSLLELFSSHQSMKYDLDDTMKVNEDMMPCC